MKHAILYIGIIFHAVGCSNPGFRPATGDLLFQVGEISEMGGAIELATGRNGQLNFTHVAIAVRSERADSVIEATPDDGVCIISLTEFLDKSARIAGKPAVLAMRMHDTSGLSSAIVRARMFLGQPYDYSFLPDNGRIYCSELVWESFLTPSGAHLFPAKPMNFLASDGSVPPYWQELFDRLGEPIPQGILGTNPNDMAKVPVLKTVHQYF